MSGPKSFFELRILEPLGKRGRVREDPAPVRGGHDDRPARVDDVANQLGAVRRRGAGRPGVREDVDAGVERMPHVLLGVDVRDDLEMVLVRGSDDRLVVVEGEPGVRLDDVDAGLGQLLGLLPGLLGARHLDLVVEREDRRRPRQPRAAHHHARAGDFTLRDPIANRQALLERRAQIDGGRDAGHQELLRGDGHHARQHRVAALLVDPREPAHVVAVAEDHQVHVRLDEPGHHRLAARVDDGRARRNPDLGRRAGRDDPVALDEDGGVVDRRNVVAGEQHAADERERFRIAGLRAHDRRNDDERGEGGGKATSTHRDLPRQD